MEAQMNIQNLMQQAQKMQRKMGVLEEEFKKESFTTEAGGGAISVTMSGDMKLQNVTIDPEIINGDDQEMLQDLLIAAVNQIITTVRKEKEAKTSKVMGKMGGGMPGLF